MHVSKRSEDEQAGVRKDHPSGVAACDGSAPTQSSAVVLSPAPKPIDVQVGQRLRSRRTSLKMTREAAASALQVSVQELQSFETGKCRVGAARLYEVAEVLDVPITFFFEDAVESAEDGYSSSIHGLAAGNQVDRQTADSA